MVRVVPIFAVVALVGCSSAAKIEAASLVHAVDAYRRAPPEGKALRGRAVGDVACTDARVCDAKQICMAAIDSTVRALALKDEVAARVADLEKGVITADSPDAKALPGKLDEAERLLNDGRDKMATCDARLLELHTTFGV